MTSTFSAGDYADAARALRPAGAAWPEDPDSVQFTVVGAIGSTLVHSDVAAVGLLVDAFPSTTYDLLPEWEASLGLPDPCVGPNPTVAQRRAQVVARFVGGGGQSDAVFTAYAAALGFDITITRYAPFRVDIDTVNAGLASEAWAFAWGVHVAANIGNLDPAALLCELRAIAPAESFVFLN